MKFRNLYSQDQKEGLILCKNRQLYKPSINLEEFYTLLNEAGLPTIEIITQDFLSKNPKSGKYISVLAAFLKNKPSDFVAKFYKLLTPKDNIENTDVSVIFIYGTKKSLARAIYGAEVYKNKNLPIIVSDKTESAKYKEFLIKKGIPEEDIFEEKNGRNFIENAYYSIKMVRDNNLNLSGIALIIASLVALRGLLTTRIFLPKETKIFSLPVEYDSMNIIQDSTSPENWYKNNKGIEIFLLEIIKLYVMSEEGLINLY